MSALIIFFAIAIFFFNVFSHFFNNDGFASHVGDYHDAGSKTNSGRVFEHAKWGMEDREDSRTLFNVDGTPMNGMFDTKGNSYGVFDNNM